MSNKKYKINDLFFNKIDSEESAYILGLLYADGCVYDGKTKWIKLDLQTKDRNILEKIANITANTCPIKDYNYHKKQYFKYSDKTYEFDHSMSRLSFRSEQMVDDLKRLGCFANKTLSITFPDKSLVPTNLLPHFIRGYFDGDGSISYHKRDSLSKSRTYSLHFTITFTGTYDFIYSLKEVLNRITIFDGDIRNRWENNKNNCTLSIDGNNIVLNILNWMYSDSHIFLERKYEKYLTLKNEIKERNAAIQYGNANRKSPCNEYFNIYKNEKYIGTCNNRRALQRESRNILGEYISRRSISNCLINKQESYHGFSFRFLSEDKIDSGSINYICCGKKLLSKETNEVSQYDLLGNYICKYDNPQKACDVLNIDRKRSSDIRCCCRHEQETAIGYIWRYT